jgi:hypothetical protein
MKSPRQRLLLGVVLGLALAWAAALGGFAVARSFKVTPDRIQRYLSSVDWNQLTSAERDSVIRRVAALLNRLSPEDRRAARMNAQFGGFLAQLNTDEKGLFLELTVPAGFQQALVAFEQMPEERRRRAISDSVRRLREAREQAESEDSAGDGDTNRPPELPPELQEKVVTLGLRSFYETGSADLKAEVAPLVEELQRSMESGRLLRDRRRSAPE